MLPEAAAAMTAVDAPRWSIFFLMHCKTETVRAWLGVGDYELGPDDVDEEGGVYQGIGLVGDIPALRQLVGGVAERVEFSLNGADETTFRLSDDQVEEVRGAPVHVGIIFFDDAWQAVAPVAWVWEGTADVPSVDMSSNGTTFVRAVKLSVGSAFTDRSRPQLGFYTDKDQRRRSPTDAFCARVAAYSVESTIVWPAAK